MRLRQVLLIIPFLVSTTSWAQGIFPESFGPANANNAVPSSLSNLVGTGARAIGMGGAFIALADDATATTWNPAGLAQLRKPEVSLVYEQRDSRVDGSFAERDALVDNSDVIDFNTPTKSTTDESLLSFASFTFPLRNMKRNFVTQFSYRKTASFPGSKTTEIFHFTRNGEVAPDETYFTRLGSEGGITTYSASGALELTENTKFGVSANYMRGDTQQRLAFTNAQDNTSDVYFSDVKFNGVLFDVGAIQKITDSIRVGVVYHSSFGTNLKYSNHNDYSPDGVLVPGGAGVKNNKTRASWPHGWGVGVAYRPVDALTFTADYTDTKWSQALIGPTNSQVVFDEVDNNEIFTRDQTGFPGIATQLDTSAIRFGAEYTILFGSTTLPLRAGYFKEDQLGNSRGSGGQPTYSGYSGGIGIVLGHIQLDAAYVRTVGNDVGFEGSSSFTDEDGNVVEIDTISRNRSKSTSNRVLLSAIVRF